MEQEQTPKKRWSWGKIALVSSLALNLLIVGLVAGAVANGDKKGKRSPLDKASMGLGLFIEALPKAQKNEVYTAAGPVWTNKRAFYKELRRRHGALEAAIVATPFDQEQVRAAVKEHREFAIGSTLKLQDAFVDALGALSEPERDAYFAEVERLREHRKARGKKYRKHKED